MKKSIFKKLGGLFLGLAMGVGVVAGAAVGTEVKEVSAGVGDTYTKITSKSDLKDGDYIIFVNAAGTYACSTTQNTNNRSLVSITTSNDSYTIAANDNVQEFKVVASATSGQFGFHTGSGYIESSSNSKNYITTNSVAETTKPSGTYAWVLNDNLSLQNATNTSYYLQVNGTSYFSQYKNTMVNPLIYKKGSGSSGPALTAITISGDMTNKTYSTVDDWDFSGLTATGTYESGDPADITQYVTWSATTQKPTEGTTSTVVTATYKEISGTKTISGLTVTKPTEYVYNKVTTNLSDWEGHYLIVSGTMAWDAHSTFSDSGTYVNLSSYQSATAITLTTQDYEWEFKKMAGINSQYSIKSQTYSGSDPLYLNEGSSSGKVGNSTSPVGMTITYNSIKAANFYLRYNASKFRFYQSSTQGDAISLWKLVEAPKYTITYVLNGATGDAPTQESLKEGAKFKLAAAPTRAGYRFDGWSDGTNTYAAGYEYTVGTSNITLTAQWTALSVTSIAVKTEPSKTLYTVGESFDPTGLVITVTFDGGSTTDVSYASDSANFTFAPSTSTELATTDTSVSITYKGSSCSQAITVEDPKVLTSITVDSVSKSTYKIGETFVKETVTAHYNQGSDENVTNSATFSGYSINTAGSQNVNVSYTENSVTKDTSYSISVKTISSFDIEGTVNGVVGEAWDTSSLTVKANWESPFDKETLTSSNCSLTVSPAEVTKGTTSVTVTVSYKNGSVTLVTKDVTNVTAKVVAIVTDTLTLADTEVTGTTYTEWGPVAKTSNARYAGVTNKPSSPAGSSNFAIKGSASAGIWTTVSGGNAKTVSIVWGSTTTSLDSGERHAQIFGKNSAYSKDDMPTADKTNYTDIRDEAKLGTYLGEIVWKYGVTNPTSIAITGSYAYICIVSNKAQVTFSSISIGWGEPDTLQSIAVSEQKTTFTAGNNFSLGDDATVTATYSESGQTTVTSETGTFTYKLDDTAITTSTILTKDDDGKEVVVTYKDQAGTEKSAAAYEITVNYAPATSLILTTSHGLTIDDPLVVSVGNPSETITATVGPVGFVEPGILIDCEQSGYEEYATIDLTNNQIIGVSEGSVQFIVYSADMEASATLYVQVSASPLLEISEEEITGVYSGDKGGELLVEASNVPQGATVTYNWSVIDADPAGCITVTQDEEDGSLATVQYLAGGSATVQVTGSIGGEIFDTKTCAVTVIQSEVTSFSIPNATPNGTIYTGDYDTTATFTPNIEVVGNASNEIVWTVTKTDKTTPDDSVTLSKTKTTGNESVVVTYNPDRTSSESSVCVIGTPTGNPEAAIAKTVTIKKEGVKTFTWTGGKAMDCFEGATLNTNEWSFAVTMNSTQALNPSIGSGDNDVHVYIVESNDITEEPTTLSKVTANQALTTADDGKYLVAFFKGTKCSSTYSLSVVGNLNEINKVEKVNDTITGTVSAKTWDSNEQTKDLGNIKDLTLVNDGGYYDYNGTKGQQIGSSKAPITSMSLSTSSVSGTITSVKVQTSGASKVNATVSVSVGGTQFTHTPSGGTATTAQSITSSNTPYEFVGSASGEVVISWTQTSSVAIYFKEITITYSGSETTQYENKNTEAQRKVIEFATFLNNTMHNTEEGQTDWCDKFDTTDAGFITAWNSVKDKYDELFGSSSTWSDASAKEIALEMLQYAYPDGRVGEVKDELQTAMARYDRIVARDSSLAKFVTRAKAFSSPVTNNPISKIVEMGDPIWVVTIALLLSVAAVAGFVIYKKRKETF